ncbi:hypothetical protein PHLGIDRAFT_188700 [Phlebiopsis gigantea 11061_1 CR5-6]|uniref:Uncharacterized protein n=1 Tax=Phlebiopsis gigantea (strain 11061_1 CR5-6) TaxID=745531 RepID=A0A0C3PG07_PHLG1|nr:hypothetical protein PHLGIDRAFT_188700 [Phlebiopsis gigantea 11061_1 CR5-6]
MIRNRVCNSEPKVSLQQVVARDSRCSVRPHTCARCLFWSCHHREGGGYAPSRVSTVGQHTALHAILDPALPIFRQHTAPSHAIGRSCLCRERSSRRRGASAAILLDGAASCISHPGRNTSSTHVVIQPSPAAQDPSAGVHSRRSKRRHAVTYAHDARPTAGVCAQGRPRRGRAR